MSTRIAIGLIVLVAAIPSSAQTRRHTPTLTARPAARPQPVTTPTVTARRALANDFSARYVSTTACQDRWFGESGYGPALWYNGYGPSIADEYWRLYEVQKRIRNDIYNEQDMAEREERLLRANSRQVRVGVEQLRAGKYSEAIIALTLAGEFDQGDPASRVHLAQARLAVGHYADAAKTLRRALELQPKLAYLPLGLTSYYPQTGDLAAHVRAFSKELTARKGRGSANEYLALGFFNLQSGKLNEAHAALLIARQKSPKDTLIRDLLAVAKPPATPTAAETAPTSKIPMRIRPPQDAQATATATASNSKPPRR